MRSLRPGLVVLMLALAAGPARAEEPPAAPPAKQPLTFAQARSGAGLLVPIPRWSWRPGHAELVRVHTRRVEKKRVVELIAMDAASGDQRTLLDLTTLRAKVAEHRGTVRGIGRAGPRTISWTKDGTALCAIVKGHLVWVDLAADTSRALTSFKAPISDVRVAPDGSGVAFCKEYEQWVVPTKEGAPYPLTTGGSEEMRNAGLDWVYPEELGHTTSTWWAPNGSALAVLQLDQADVPTFSVPRVLALHARARTMRYPKVGDPNPKARLRVYPVDGQGRYVDMHLGTPAPEYIVRVTWVPDSKRLLVVTSDRAQQNLAIHLCDAATGKSDTILRKADAAWNDVPEAPTFVRDDVDLYFWREYVKGKFPKWGLFPLSTDEYSFPADAADFEYVGRPSVGDAKGRALANVRMSPDRETVLRMGEIEPLPFLPDAPSVRASFSPANDFALITHASPTAPATTALYRMSDGKRLRVIGSAKGPRFDKVPWATQEQGTIEIPGVDSGEIRWRLYKPHDFDPARKYPVIVHTYGGPNSRMIRPGWSRGLLWSTYLTQRGFLVLQVDGRGSGGQSHAFTRLVRGKLGRLEIDDQATAVQTLAKRPYFDGERVGIWGWSFGGTMACNGVIFRGDVFKAAVAVAPVTDWRLYDSIYTERYMGLLTDNKAAYDAVSSVKHAKNLKGHLLLVHGLSDDNVHAQNSYRLMEALLRAKKTTFDIVTYPDRGHGIGGPGHNDVFRRMLAWFETHL